MDGNELQINAAGNLVIPAEILKVLGWAPGSRVAFEISGAGIRLDQARGGVMPQDQRADLHATMEMSRDAIRALTDANLKGK